MALVGLSRHLVSLDWLIGDKANWGPRSWSYRTPIVESSQLQQPDLLLYSSRGPGSDRTNKRERPSRLS
jgi:hypothetical protein